MKIADWLRENESKYPDKDTLVTQCAKALSVEKSYVLREYTKRIETKSPDPQKPLTGLTEKDIRARHDMMYKIREGAKQLEKGLYLTDQQMREHCKVPPQVWRGYSENQEFDKFKLKLGKVIYWGLPEGVNKLRGDLNA